MNNNVKNNKILERQKFLQQWKEKKKIRLENQKALEKPAFKVSRVSHHYNINLSKIYGEIKGKMITKKPKEAFAKELERKSKPFDKNVFNTNKVEAAKAKPDEEALYVSTPRKKKRELNLPKNLKAIRRIYTSAIYTPLGDFEFWKPKHISTPYGRKTIE